MNQTNPLIKLYDKMLNDPDAYDLMIDPVFEEKTTKMVRTATPEQHKEFDEYVVNRLQAQLAKLNCRGEDNDKSND